MIAFSSIFTATNFRAIFTVTIRCARTLALVPLVAFLAMALSIIRITFSAVCAIALLLAFLAVVVWWATWNNLRDSNVKLIAKIGLTYVT